MTEQTTALAQPTQKPLAVTLSDLAASALCVEMAEAASVTPESFLVALKNNAVGRKRDGTFIDVSVADILVFMAGSKKFDLDPMASPPEYQLLNFGDGPRGYARVDAYKKHVRKARESGEVRWAHYAEEWREDPRHPPGDVRTDKDNKPIGPWPQVRCGVVRFQLRNDPHPAERVVWLHEWIMPGNPNWQNRTSQMLCHRGWKEFMRDYCGYAAPDTDDGERLRDSMSRDAPKQVEATVSDAKPVIPIAGLRPPGKPEFASAPRGLDLDDDLAGARDPRETQGNANSAVSPVEASAEPQRGNPSASSGSDAGPAASPAPPEFDPAESARIDAEIAAEQKKREGLFG